MTEHLTYDDLRTDTVRQVAKLMAAAAITAPKSGGQLFLAGKHTFMETVIVEDADTRHELAEWMRARGKERREAIWFRDADVAEVRPRPPPSTPSTAAARPASPSPPASWASSEPTSPSACPCR